MHEHHADPMQRLAKARAQLLKRVPFWAPILYRLKPELTAPSYPGFLGTDGEKLRMNPHRCRKLTDPELAAGVAHEILHILSEHHIRAHGKAPDTWQRATDFCVNLLLVEMFGEKTYPIRLPVERIPYDPKYAGMSAEAIYRELLNEKQPDEEPGARDQDQDERRDEPRGQVEDDDPDDGQEDRNGHGGGNDDELEEDQDEHRDEPNGELQDAVPDESHDERNGHGGGREDELDGGEERDQGIDLGRIEPSPEPEKAKADLRARLAEIEVQAAALGIGDHMDAALRRAIERAEISFDWEKALASYLFDATLSAGCDDYAWMRPNPHLLHSFDVIMPGTVRQDPPPLVIAIDTSGSISDEQLAQIAGGITELATQYEDLETDVLYVDTDIRGRQRFRTGQPIELEPVGGGGTDFAALFAELARHPPEFLAFFTDLWVTSFGKGTPSYPVLWIYTGNGEVPPIKPPFGKIVRLRPE